MEQIVTFKYQCMGNDYLVYDPNRNPTVLSPSGIARLCDVPVLAALDRPKTSDQRALGRAERIANLAGRFHALSHVKLPAHVLLVDDVYTTGATLCSAADALLKAGAETVGCCTFTRA